MYTRNAWIAITDTLSNQGRPLWGEKWLEGITAHYARNREKRGALEEIDAMTKQDARMQNDQYDPLLPLDLPRDPRDYLIARRAYEYKAIVEYQIAEARRNNKPVDANKKRVNLMKWPDPTPGRTDYEAMPDIYYEIEKGRLYMLNYRNPANFPNLVDVERARQKAQKEAEDKAAADAAAKAAAKIAQQEREAQEAEAKKLKEQQDAQAEEERRVQAKRDAYVGEPQSGNQLNQSHVVIPIPDKHADGFYKSMCLLRALRNDPPLESYGTLKETEKPLWDAMRPVRKLRFNALKWLYRYGDDSSHRNELLRGTDTFKESLNPNTPTPTNTPYSLGMSRATAQMNEWRRTRKADRAGPFEDWETPIDGPEGAIARNATSTEREAVRGPALIGQYYKSQLSPFAWPTLYDVDALAHVLDAPIYLYANSEQPGMDERKQDWMFALEPRLKLGPETSSKAPYRLLWSADRTMRFRPLVYKGDNPDNSVALGAAKILADGTCSDDPAKVPTSRNDRVSKLLPADYYTAVPEQFPRENSLAVETKSSRNVSR